MAAHPDDETIGAYGVLSRDTDVYVVHTTDGAPRDRRYHPPGLDVARNTYRAMRKVELSRALGALGVPIHRVVCLGAADQEAARSLATLATNFTRLLTELAPAIVVTHAYEGGHPDHDATCLAAHAACGLIRERGRTPPVLVEMAGYHGASGALQVGHFLPPRSVDPRASSLAVPGQRPSRGLATLLDVLGRWATGEGEGDAEETFTLAPEDRRRKADMLAAFETQRATLSAFGVEQERYRPAPRYRFDLPPHPGRLYYEQLAWSTTGTAFRSLTASALRQLGWSGTPWL